MTLIEADEFRLMVVSVRIDRHHMGRSYCFFFTGGCEEGEMDIVDPGVARINIALELASGLK